MGILRKIIRNDKCYRRHLPISTYPSIGYAPDKTCLLPEQWLSASAEEKGK